MKKIIYLSFILFFAFGQTVNGQADNRVVPNSLNVSPTTQHIGMSVDITMSIQNIGSSTAGASLTKIYISPNTNKSAGKLLGEISLESILAGDTSSNIHFIHPVPYGVSSGTHYIIVSLNETTAITESNYLNNESSTTISINTSPWAAQYLPYPVIFIHGLISSDQAWNTLIDSLAKNQGWSFGGRMD
jgi:hypothetical protein